jgi:hypothetical protein
MTYSTKRSRAMRRGCGTTATPQEGSSMDRDLAFSLALEYRLVAEPPTCEH